MSHPAWSPWDIQAFIYAEGHLSGSAVAGAPNYFGLVGFKQSSVEVDDVGLLRIAIWRELGSIGNMQCTVAVKPGRSTTGNPEAIEGTDFIITNKTLDWLFVQKIGFPYGEKGPKYLEIQLLRNLSETKSFTIEIVSALVIVPLINFDVTFAIKNVVGPWIAQSRKRFTVTMNPVIREQGQVGFGQAAYTEAEFKTIDIDVNRYSGIIGPVAVVAETIPDDPIDAISNVHYTKRIQVLSWTDGDAVPKVFAVPLLGVPPVSKRFKVRLRDATGGVIIDTNFREATVDIQDNPVAPGNLAFVFTFLYAIESTTLTVLVRRVQGDTGAISVEFRTVDGSAVAGTHFTNTTGTLNWANQDSAAKAIMIPILAVDQPLFFQVEIFTPGGGAGLLAGFEFVGVVIRDDDPTVLVPPPPENKLELRLVDNLAYQSTLQPSELVYVQQTSLAIFADRLLNGVLGWSGGISSFGGGSDLPPQGHFGDLTLKQKYGMSAGA